MTEKVSPVQKVVSMMNGRVIGTAVELVLQEVVGKECGFFIMYRPMKGGVGTCDLVSNGGDAAQIIEMLEQGIKMMKEQEGYILEQVRASSEEREEGKGDTSK
jgi:stage III sporulation protein SpoIIIAA